MKKFTCVLLGTLMVASVLTGCGKKDNTSTVNNEKNSPATQTQEVSSKEINERNQDNDNLLESHADVFAGFTAQLPKGYKKNGIASQVVFNSKDESDLYIAMVYDTTKKVLSEMNEQSISEYISRQMYADGGISKHINGYTKDAPVKITTVSDTQVNGMKMKKYEGTITLAKSSVDKETTWDCYIYGYAFETTTTTIMYLGLEQEQSQSTDKIELIKKNMDAMVQTIQINK